MIVDRTANLTAAADIAVQACFANSGQLCISVERIYLHQDIAEAFTEQFVHKTQQLSVGIGGWEYDMGSLISAEHANKVHEFVKDAIDHGANVLTGAQPPQGALYQPTILANVPETARLYHEEVFGPVVYLEIVADETEAVNKANETEYGLNAAVVGKPAVARRIARRLQAGTVNINEGFAAAWGSVAAPMGGWKASGLGRRHGTEGLLKYTQPRTVAQQRVIPLTGPKNLRREEYARYMSAALRLGKRIL